MSISPHNKHFKNQLYIEWFIFLLYNQEKYYVNFLSINKQSTHKNGNSFTIEIYSKYFNYAWENNTQLIIVINIKIEPDFWD